MPVGNPGFVVDAAINSHEPATFAIGACGMDDLPEQLIKSDGQRYQRKTEENFAS
jgi:hypothetical protein